MSGVRDTLSLTFRIRVSWLNNLTTAARPAERDDRAPSSPLHTYARNLGDLSVEMPPHSRPSSNIIVVVHVSSSEYSPVNPSLIASHDRLITSCVGVILSTPLLFRGVIAFRRPLPRAAHDARRRFCRHVICSLCTHDCTHDRIALSVLFCCHRHNSLYTPACCRSVTYASLHLSARHIAILHAHARTLAAIHCTTCEALLHPYLSLLCMRAPRRPSFVAPARCFASQ